MKFKSVLPDIIIMECALPGRVMEPVYSADNFQVNQHEFSLQVPEVGSFFAHDGKKVEFSVAPGADPDWVRLYLNGQVVVALLHQRKIITFHASSFIHEGRGVMILGESGAGKSSLTASFTLKGAKFLSDDITPVIFKGSKPHIWPLHGAIRIRRNTAYQLNINTDKLTEAEAGTEKQYLQVNLAGIKDFPLHTILEIEIGEVERFEFHEPSPVEKFSLLRSEICMWELLAGMPETEVAYLQRLVKIVKQVKIVRVVRPAGIEISVLHAAVRNYLEGRRLK